MPTTSAVCRTVVVLVYLIALASAGTPTWATAGAGLSLVAVWLAPVLLTIRRRRQSAGAVTLVAVSLQPSGAGLRGSVR